MPNSSRILRCKYCDDTFQRNGHLQRHLLRHSGVKSFTCGVCTKSFSRNDTLLRHEATHRHHDSEQNDKRKGLKACDPCVQAKQRCFGGDPCARCEQRRATCGYSSEVRQSSTRFKLDNLVSSGQSYGAYVERDPVVSPTSLPIVPTSASTIIEMDPQILTTPSPKHLSVPNSLVESSSEETHRTSWPDPLPLLSETISAEEIDMFTNYLPHDMRCAGDRSYSFGSPFLWMTQPLESPSWPSLASGRDISTSHRANDGNPVPPAIIERADFAEPSRESYTAVDSGDARIREILNAIHTSPADVCPSFPILQEDELQSADAELFGHVSKIPENAYTALRAFYVSERGYDDMLFPQCRLLHAFVELYFEYFDPHLPCLHPMRVETDDLSWILLTSIAAIGSQYSEVRDAAKFSVVLQSLLRRATHFNDLHSIAKRSDISIVQSVLLRDVGLMFSGSVSDQTAFQHDKGILVTLCRSLTKPTSFCNAEESIFEHDLDQRWMAWLQEEEFVRLAHCVYIVECLQLVFFDLRSSFRLTDLTHRLPCEDNAWRCRSANKWSREKQQRSSDGHIKNYRSFSTRSSILSLYANERTILDHKESSRRLKSLIRSGLSVDLQEPDVCSARRQLLSFGASEDDISFLDALIDDAVTCKSFSDSELECSSQDPIVHVVALLRDLPLRTIYASVGWQANGREMQRSRDRLKGYLQSNQSTARICLWHAARIYSTSRSLRCPAYYSSLSFAIAVTYILLYCQIIPCLAQQEDLLRLDKVAQKADIDAWLRGFRDSRVHITGVGALDNGESSHRLLLDAEKALRSQRPWRSMSQILANCFAQMSRGQIPSIG